MSKAEETAEAKSDPLHEARERFKYAKEAWSDDRRRYVSDQKFRNGEQWPESVRQLREKDNRPCLVVDKLSQYIRQVVNDSRMNRPSIKVRPVDNDADIETADIYQGLIRHIEDRSSADVAYDTALECAVSGGFGFMRVLSEYAHDATFDQELCIKRVRNPLTVYLDPDCQEPDGSDARYCFVTEEIDKEDFEAQYPKADAVDWESDDAYTDWCGAEKVTVAEYWRIVEEDVETHLLHDGTTCTAEEYQAAIAEGIEPPPIKDTRKLKSRVLKWSKINGKEELEPTQTRPGKWIPVVPVWGNEIDIEGKVMHTSMHHTSKDAQRLYNYSRSAFAERVALTPKAPFLAAAGAIEDYEAEWEASNTENVAVLRYNHRDEQGNEIPAPRREQASDIPAGFAQDMQMSEHDIQGALGMYNASLGERSNEKSGRAILARQKEGDTSTFHYHDNLARAIRHIGRILVDLIPKVYDSNRTVRILGMDGAADMASLDPTLPVASAKMNGKKVFNLGVGTYDVSVSTGPSYTTRRQEAADAMVQLTQGNPALMGIIGDLMIKAMDWPQADEIAERLKLMLPPQIQEAEKQDGEMPPEVQAIMQQAQQAIQEREQALQVMQEQMQQAMQEMDAMKREAEAKHAEIALKAREIGVKEYDAETKRAQVLAPAFDASQVQQLVLQTLQDIFNQEAAPVEPVPQYDDMTSAEMGIENAPAV